jgi:hypothetical protein
MLSIVRQDAWSVMPRLQDEINMAEEPLRRGDRTRVAELLPMEPTPH